MRCARAVGSRRAALTDSLDEAARQTHTAAPNEAGVPQDDLNATTSTARLRAELLALAIAGDELLADLAAAAAARTVEHHAREVEGALSSFPVIALGALDQTFAFGATADCGGESVSSKVSGKVSSKVSGKVSGEVGGKVSSRGWGKVSSKVSGKVSGNVSSRVSGKVSSRVSSSVSSRVSRKISGKISSSISNRASGSVYDS